MRNWHHPANLLPLLIALVISGCGGGKATVSKAVVKSPHIIEASVGRKATATFTIHWPPRNTRAIPANTNRIILYVTADDIPGAMAYIVDRPTFDVTTAFSVNILAGHNRRFAVEARQVDQTNPFYSSHPIPVAFDSPDLLAGTKLGGGVDTQAHTISPGEPFPADIRVSDPGAPGTGAPITSVAITINQILQGSFPNLLTLQLIRDQNGNPITNLNAGNFTVTEDGAPAAITDVRTVLQDSRNLSVALVCDRSGSMSDVTDSSSSLTKNDALEASASSFIDLIQPVDSAEVINFDTTVEVTQSFTTDKALLKAAITNQFSRFGGDTSLYNALSQAVADTSNQTGRTAVLALTDGKSNSGSKTQADVISAAKQKGIPVFTLGLGSDADQASLQQVAAQTGGTFTFTPSATDLKSVYQRIASQLNGQMQLSFITPDTSMTGKLRHVVVKFTYGSLTGTSDYYYTQ